MTNNGLMENCPFACMIRHAEKERVDSDPFGNSVGLTRKGKEDAFKFGQDFKSKYGEIDRIVSSPLRRCVETAEEISRAFDSDVIIERSELLGNPGAYIEDPELARKHFLEMSPEEVVRNLIDGVHMNGFRTIEHGFTMISKKIKNDLKISDSPIIYVTHDVIMFPFFVWLSGIDTEKWFNYIEPIFLLIQDSSLKCIRN